MRYTVHIFAPAEFSVVITVPDDATDEQIIRAAMDEERNWRLEDVDTMEAEVDEWSPIKANPKEVR